MTRPKKVRIVQCPPAVWAFKPQGIPAKVLDWVELTLDECEALRLVDFEGLTHEEAAEHMGISRPTLTRLIESAHKKISEALFEGKVLRISGPSEDTILRNDRFYCRDCWHSWTARAVADCPDCGSNDVLRWSLIGGPGRRIFRRKGR